MTTIENNSTETAIDVTVSVDTTCRSAKDIIAKVVDDFYWYLSGNELLGTDKHTGGLFQLKCIIDAQVVLSLRNTLDGVMYEDIALENVANISMLEADTVNLHVTGMYHGMPAAKRLVDMITESMCTSVQLALPEVFEQPLLNHILEEQSELTLFS